VASLKTKGDLAELKVAADLVERGYRIAFPFGEDYRSPNIRQPEMEPAGFEPATSCLQSRRSPN
jgi:hypothetical protein